MPDDSHLMTTMRIDITPEALARAGKGAGVSTIKRPGGHTTVIRIPSKKAATTRIGGADFDQLLQNIYDGAVITDPHGEIHSANIRALQFFHCERESQMRGNVTALISGADASLLTTILQTLENDRFVLIQAYCLRRDGSLFPAEISVNRLPLSGSDCLSFFFRDITLRKEAEERLRTVNTAIQNASSGIAITDLKAVLTYCNPASLRLWNVADAEAALGRDMREFLAQPERVAEVIAAIDRREHFAGEVEIRRPDGSLVDAHVSVAPNLNTDGELVGMVWSLLDISEQKRARQQLERYARELSERNRQMENDLSMARDIEQALLPKEYPLFPPRAAPDQSCVRFGHLYIPSGLVGGDFFDVLPLTGTQVGLFISDVMGHGMRAALVVATIRGLIEQLLASASHPGEMLTRLNQAHTHIFRQTGEVMFSTAFYGVLDIVSGRLLYAGAGHPPPILARGAAGTSVSLLAFHEGVLGPALGLFDDSVYGQEECRLEPGDRLVLYTDGIYEAQGPRGEEFDTARLLESLRRGLAQPVAGMLEALVAEVQIFSGSTGFEDDVCLLGVELARRYDPATEET